MEEFELKPNPYRVSHVVVDLVPFALGAWTYLEMTLTMFPEPFSGAISWLMATYLIAMTSGLCMHLSQWTTLRRLANAPWRESLYLSQMPARLYIRHLFDRRVKIWLLSFAFPFICLVVGTLLVFEIRLTGEFKGRFFEAAVGLGGFVYSALSMLLCAACIGLWGLAGRLRALCRPRESSMQVGLTTLKWVAITVLTPFLLVLCGVLAAFWLLDIFHMYLTDAEFALLLGMYFIAVSTCLNFFFFRGMRRSWRKAIEEYYQFE